MLYNSMSQHRNQCFIFMFEVSRRLFRQTTVSVAASRKRRRHCPETGAKINDRGQTGRICFKVIITHFTDLRRADILTDFGGENGRG